MEKKKLFLLDAYALIFRAYYAFINRQMINSKGLNTSAIFGFTITLDEILRNEKPSHIAVVFDPPSPTFRHELYPDYKANREETPEEIKKSVPYIKRIIEGFNIPIVEAEGYEADDVIGTLSKAADQAGFEVYMMTPDKDFAQLVRENVYMYKPRKSSNEPEILGPKQICEQFHVKDPRQVIDILALWGDSSDNVPGAPGIGEKTAKKLISEFGSLDNVFENTDKLKGKQQESIINNREQIELSRELVTIKLDAPVQFNEDNLKYSGFDQDALSDLFDELEFRTIKNRILGDAPQIPRGKTTAQGTLFDTGEEEEVDQADLDTLTTRDHSYFLCDTKERRVQLINRLSKVEALCFDTETTSINPMHAELVGLAFSFRAGEAYYVPFPEDQVVATEIIQEFKPLFEDENTLKIGQNIKYDIQVLENYEIHVEGRIFDTMLAHYLLQPELKHNLDYLSQHYLKYKPVSIEDLIGKKGSQQGNMRQVAMEKITDYACEDADLTWQLYLIFKEKLRNEKLNDLAEKIEFPLVRVLSDMEYAGVNLDTKVLSTYAIQLNEEISNLQTEIHKLAGIEFNISSPKQLGEILFDRLKISADVKKTKSNTYSTSEDILVKLADKHPIINKVLEYRTLKKLISTYVEALPKLIEPRTKKIHTSYNQAVAATGRLSSNNPNLQNIPIREERGREIRKAFIPSSDKYILLSADYSQIELRLMAHLSRDENMMEAFRNDEDIHEATAAKIYGVSPEAVSKEMRNKAKTANFGIIYGISAFGLSQRLHIKRHEAKELIDGYFRSYPGVRKYMEQSIRDAKSKGYVETLLGRRRYLRDINSRNAVVRGFAERNAINAPIQGSAADIIKIAMINTHRRMINKGLKTKMILQVHDELVFDVLESELEEVKEIVIEEMEKAYPLNVPLVVDYGIGENWLEAH